MPRFFVQIDETGQHEHCPGAWVMEETGDSKFLPVAHFKWVGKAYRHDDYEARRKLQIDRACLLATTLALDTSVDAAQEAANG